jgi:uncharacterized protein involved in copper resistance
MVLYGTVETVEARWSIKSEILGNGTTLEALAGARYSDSELVRTWCGRGLNGISVFQFNSALVAVCSDAVSLSHPKTHKTITNLFNSLLN